MKRFEIFEEQIMAGINRLPNLATIAELLPGFAKRSRRRFLTRYAPGIQTESLECRSLLSSTPLAEWRFEETSGTTVIDSTSPAANGTNFGAAPGIGAIGGGLLFDGLSDKVEFGTGASLAGTTSFTVTAWIRTNATKNQVIIQQRDVDGYNGEYILGIVPEGKLSFVIFGDGANQFLIGTPQSVNDGAWHHVAAGREGTRGFIFLDGMLAAETYGPVRSLASTIGVAVGADIRANDSFFDGSIDEVSIYASAVPASEIAAEANIIVPQGVSRNPRPVFTWPTVQNAASYSLWVERIGGTNNPLINQTVTVNHFEATADLGFGQFRTWVRATLNDGTRTAWRLQTFEINGKVNFQPIALQQTTYRPELQWEPFPGADHYDLWIDNVSTGQTQVVRNQNLSTASWTSPTDLPFGRYQVYIRAVDQTGVATHWTRGPAFNIAVAPTPTAPLNSTFERQPQFTWTAVPGAQGYEVFVRNTQTQATTYAIHNISQTSWTPPAPLPVAPYQWWVSAIGVTNLRGVWSEGIRFSVGGMTEIISPVGTTNSLPLISWNAVTGAGSYWLWVDRVGVQTSYINQTGITSTSFQPVTPLPAGLYRAWVRAVSTTSENSAWSAPFEFTVSS